MSTKPMIRNLMLVGMSAMLGFAAAAGAADVPGSVSMTRPFSNRTQIVVEDDGVGSLYPSSIAVAGMTGLVTRVTVTLFGVSHPYPDDLDVLLVAPSGQKMVLMSDAGASFPLENTTFSFAEGAPQIPNNSQIMSMEYTPGNFAIGSDMWPAPAPSGPYPVGLTNLYGGIPNGAWRLFVVDDALESEGSIAGGWSLTVTSTEVLPTLDIARVAEGRTVVITWPTSAVGYSLKSRPRLNVPPSWAAVTNSVVVTNEQNRVTLPASGVGQFFRLQR